MGGTDPILNSYPDCEVALVGPEIPKPIPKGSKGGYLGGETYAGSGNVNKSSACPSVGYVEESDSCSTDPNGGISCNVTLCEVPVITVAVVDKADASKLSANIH